MPDQTNTDILLRLLDMASCKVFVFSALLAVFLCSEVSADEVYNQICNDLKEEVTLCVGTSKLVDCVQLHEIWYGVELADCGLKLCCDASILGCRANCALTTPSTSTTLTTAKPKECDVGDLKADAESNIHYWYCSNNSWVQGKCPIGHYDQSHQSCTL